MPYTCISDIAQEMYPCHDLILQVTGRKAPMGLGTAVPCGTGRWCHHCEKMLSLLGKCAHVPLLTDVLVVVLKSSCEASRNGNTEFWNAPPVLEHHDCGPACPHA